MAAILLAEDDLAIRDFVRLALEMDGHKVVTVHNGAEAMERILADAGVYDLLVTDIRMPVTDGIALASQVVDAGISLPILVMTGCNDAGDKLDQLGACIRDVMIKPFTLEMIRDRVNAILSEDNPVSKAHSA